MRAADLTGANLRDASLTQADLHAANLTGADLSEEWLAWTDLTGAKLTGADLSNVNGVDDDMDAAIGADFTGALNVPKEFLQGNEFY